MKKTLLLFITLLGMATVQAEDYKYLTIVGIDGTKTSLTAVGLSISFSDTQLTAKNAYTDETATIALTNLASMNFSNTDETTGIRTIQVGETNGKSDAIYNLQGEQLPANATLPKGIYIIKKGNETQKVIVK
ncbi:hypothetical protein [Prevotella sp. P6B1]|uniref:hypothetical protein n=1 Tax=Prevotella sp. P6B1 TaxID=1410613 RepID=UPI00051AE67E|nr:hypothetical protein [Prevotella sp. P6B1]